MSELEALRTRLRQEIDARERAERELQTSQLHEARRADDAEEALRSLQERVQVNLPAVLEDLLSSYESEPFIGIGATAVAKRIEILAEVIGSTKLVDRARAFGERARKELAPLTARWVGGPIR